jgi:ATP-dependent helicase/nuclease subunit A
LTGSGGQFTPEQWAAITDRGREVAVSAAAGSGKTTVLVERIVQRLLGWTENGYRAGQATNLERLLIMTFTRKAAGEMKQRLQQRLAAAIVDDSLPTAIRELASSHLRRMPLARVGTIHSFCISVIHSHGAVRGVRRGRSMPENESRFIRHQLCTDFLDRKLDGQDPAAIDLALAWGGADGVGADEVSLTSADAGLRPLMLQLLDFRRSLVDPNWWFTHWSTWHHLPDEFDPRAPAAAGLLSQFKAWCDEARIKAESLSNALSAACPSARQLAVLQHQDRLLELVASRLTWASLQAGLVRFEEAFDGKLSALSISVAGIEDERLAKLVRREGEAFRRDFSRWRKLFADDWSVVVQRERHVGALLETLWRLTTEFESEYAEYKSRRGMRDFSDLERETLALLASGPGLEPTAVAMSLRAGLDEVLVDEYQDTNELQDAILRLATPQLPVHSGQVPQRFVVGDIKQSIYGFRLADPHLFQDLCQRLRHGAAESGWHFALTTNFRSTPSIVRAVNAVFSDLFTAQFGGEDYRRAQLVSAVVLPEDPTSVRSATLSVVRTRNTTSLCEQNSAKGQEAEDCEEPTEGTATDLPRYCAQHLLQLHAARTLIHDAGGEQRPLRWGDIAILLRSSTPLNGLRRELECAGIPHSSQGRTGFYERPEIADILALLSVIDNPLRDVPLAAALHGPAAQLSPTELLEIARPVEAFGVAVTNERLRDDVSFWSKVNRRSIVEDVLGTKLRAVLGQFSMWRGLADELSLPQLLWHLVRESGILLSASSTQAHANLMALFEMARQFKTLRGPTLSGFLEYIRHDRRAAGDLGEVSVSAGSSDEVQILTIHQAKGKEFPVVLIPLQSRFNMQDLNRDVIWKSRSGIGGNYFNLHDKVWEKRPTLAWQAAQARARHELLEEELRIMYVGLTRARERLELVVEANPDELSMPSIVSPQRAKSPWDWLKTQITNKPETFSFTNESLAPWSILMAQSSPTASVQASIQETILPGALARIEQLARAQYCGPADSPPYKLSVTAITENRRGAAGSQVMADSVGSILERHAAASRGSFIHGVIQALVKAGRFSVDCTIKDLQYATVAIGGRAELLNEMADIQAAVISSCRALGLQGCKLFSELSLSSLFGAHELRELLEEATTWPSESSVLVQGTLDLLVKRPDGSALIVDFKTDRVVVASQLLDRYRQQLTLYGELVSRTIGLRSVDWAIYGVGTVGLVGPFKWTKRPVAGVPDLPAVPLAG